MKKLAKRITSVVMAIVMTASMSVLASADDCNHVYNGQLYGEPHYTYTTHQHPIPYTENGVVKYTYVAITTTVRLLRQTCIYCGSSFTTSTTTGSTHSVQA